MPTPTSIPAPASFSIARRRCFGWAVPGSVLRQISSSRVGMLDDVSGDGYGYGLKYGTAYEAEAVRGNGNGNGRYGAGA